PETVRISASRPKASKEITLHFVNYNRDEPAKPRSAGGGIKDEKPIAVKKIDVDMALPRGVKVRAVQFATPEPADVSRLKFVVANGRLRIAIPEFLVYAIARVELD